MKEHFCEANKSVKSNEDIMPHSLTYHVYIFPKSCVALLFEDLNAKLYFFSNERIHNKIILIL